MEDVKEKRIGFIGIGLMGEPIVDCMLKSGIEVTIWNRSKEKTIGLRDRGAVVANSISDLVAKSDLVFICVSDTQSVEGIVFGPGGIAEYGSKGKLLIDLSSINPRSTIDFSVRLKERCGMDWIDSPVSGGVGSAKDGTLIVMTGGNENQIESIRNVFSTFSKKMTHMGPIGSGQMTKVCNQMIVACNAVAIAETVALARKSGVDVEKLAPALSGGFADSMPFQILVPQMSNHDETLKWKVSTLLKDLDCAVDLSVDFDCSIPFAGLGSQIIRRHSSKGNSKRDLSTLIELYE